MLLLDEGALQGHRSTVPSFEGQKPLIAHRLPWGKSGGSRVALPDKSKASAGSLRFFAPWRRKPQPECAEPVWAAATFYGGRSRFSRKVRGPHTSMTGIARMFIWRAVPRVHGHTIVYETQTTSQTYQDEAPVRGITDPTQRVDVQRRYDATTTERFDQCTCDERNVKARIKIPQKPHFKILKK